MNTTSLIVSVLLALSAICAATDSTDKKKKLQIGVKKRIDPENCPIKSRKGDTLHMHYTVCNSNLSGCSL
jgi:FK506-binding protein 2